MVYHLSIFSYSTVLQGLGQSIYPFTRSVYLSFYLSIPSICPSGCSLSVYLSFNIIHLFYTYIHLSVSLSLCFILVLSVILQSYLSLTSICLCPSIYIFVSFICQSVSMSYILSQSYLYLRLSVCVCQSIYLFLSYIFSLNDIPPFCKYFSGLIN